MALAYETNSDLAFDTDVLRAQGTEYAKIAGDLSKLASDLDGALEGLAASGWSTPAGSAFHDMTDSGWKDNIEKYVDLLNTLNEVLTEAADAYDALVEDDIRTAKVNA